MTLCPAEAPPLIQPSRALLPKSPGISQSRVDSPTYEPTQTLWTSSSDPAF